jgi:hypothetical protein
LRNCYLLCGPNTNLFPLCGWKSWAPWWRFDLQIEFQNRFQVAQYITFPRYEWIVWDAGETKFPSAGMMMMRVGGSEQNDAQAALCASLQLPDHILRLYLNPHLSAHGPGHGFKRWPYQFFTSRSCATTYFNFVDPKSKLASVY